MKVTKAVVLAAGHGTRMLPATKAMPKEMLTIVDKPAIQYIVEEIAASGIHDILIVTSRGKSVLEDHFDRAPELETALLRTNREALYEQTVALTRLADIKFVRQQEMKGTGSALMYARSFVGKEPFALLYGDDVIVGEDPACGQVCRAYEEFGGGALAIKEVSLELVQKYSSMKVSPLRDNLYRVTDMIEKPKPEEILSRFAILGRCVLPPEIFTLLEDTPPGAGGEIQVTDAMKRIARERGMVGVDFTGCRYDMGNKLGVLKAIVEVGLQHDEVGADFREYLRELSSTL